VLGGHIRGLIKAINGVGDTATDHVNALEKLTLRQDLIYLTLLPWREVLSERRLSRSYRVWCPECFEDRRLARQPVYEQLLWTLEAVEICPTHNVALESACPHCQRDGLPLLASGTRPGYCSDCRRWLGGKKRAGAIRGAGDIERLLFTASSCGELLSKADGLEQFPRRITVATTVYECVSYFAGRSVNDLARAVGMPGKTISNWRRGEHVPQLDFLILFCRRLGLNLAGVLTGNLVLPARISRPDQAVPEVKGFKKFIPYDEGKVRRQLEAALVRVPAPSLRAVTREVGMNGKKLKRYFPQLCRAVVEKFKKQHGNRWAKVAQVMDAALKENPPPSVLEVAHRLGCAKSSLYQRLPDNCHQIAERFIKQQRVQSVRMKEEFIAEIRAIALTLHADGIYPSSRAVSAKLLKPGRVNTALGRKTLREIRAELYGEKGGMKIQQRP